MIFLIKKFKLPLNVDIGLSDGLSITDDINESKKLDPVKLLHSYMISGEFNANDFFNISCSEIVRISKEDFEWVIDHISKYDHDGLNSSIAYIQNQEPLDSYRTDTYNKALSDLIKRNQKVYGDIDFEFYQYNEKGPYRIINKN